MPTRASGRVSRRFGLTMVLFLFRGAAAQETITIPPAGVVTWDERVQLQSSLPPAPERPPRVIPFMPVTPVDIEVDWPIDLETLPAPPPTVAPFTASGPRALALAPLAPTVTAGFPALGDDNTAIPPDTNGAVGPLHLMTMLNTQTRIQDKAGGVISTVSTEDFWTVGTGLTGNTFDPRILYDQSSGRWMASIDANAFLPTSKFFFAISATSDAAGAWTFYEFPADPGGTTWADFDTLGVNGTWIAVNNAMFCIGAPSTCPGALSIGLVGSKMWVIDKATALAGGPLTVTVFPTGFANTCGIAPTGPLQPALTFDPSEPTLHIADHGILFPGGVSYHRLSRITGTGSAPSWSPVPGSTFSCPSSSTPSGLFAVFAYDVPQIDAAQAGTATRIDTLDVRLSQAVLRNGRLWYAHSGGLPVGAIDRTAVFWYQVDPGAMPAPILQGGVFDGGPDVHHWAPSISANANDDAFIAFSRSDATRFAEAVGTGRLGTDPPGTMTLPLTVLKAGEDIYEKNGGSDPVRWGDYSATLVDPVDDLTLWTIQEYAETHVGAVTDPNNHRWGTWWSTTGTTPALTTLDRRVAGGSDDAEEKPSGSVNTSSGDLELVDDDGLQTVGIRFRNVTIPPGATIVTAYVQFQVDEETSEATNLLVQGQSSNNAAAFSSSKYSISSRLRTAASVPWSPPPWAPPTGSVGSAGVYQRTPELREIVQEIVNLPGWVSGRPLAVIITGTGKRVAESYEGKPSGAPLLHVVFGVGPTTSTTTTTTPTTTTVTSTTGAPTTTTTTTTTTPPAVTTLERRVAASADDAEEDEDGNVSLTSSDLELVQDGDNQIVGIRFRNVTVPREKTIVNAWVQFQVDETNSGTTSLRIYGQTSDNAAAFTSADGNVSSRPKTGNYVSWAPPAWTSEGAAGTAQRTPNLKDVLQPIVNRSGWPTNGGNALVVIITGTGKRVAEAYDGQASGAPLLHIEYAP
jgi:hypothetical protein